MNELPVKTKDSMFTDQQWEAIHMSGSNLLISASAGSGKTMVLVNRIIEKIKKGSHIDELLVVTFTNAAAKEMKQRIERSIQTEINSDPEHQTRHHLVEQLPKLGHANISTLHSFCLEVIQRYYYLIDFDPVFRQLTDDTEIELIKEEVWLELLEELYERGEDDFLAFMETYSGSKSDDDITNMVFRLHDFSRANEQPVKWLDSLTDLYEVPNNQLQQSKVYLDYLKHQWLEEVSFAEQLIEQAIELTNNEESLEKQIGIFNEDKLKLQQLIGLIESDQLEQLHSFIANKLSFSRLTAPSKKATDEDVLEMYRSEIKPLRDEMKKVIDTFKKQFVLTPDEQVEMMKQTKTHIQVLAELTKVFSERFQAYKAERKLVDFSDLEYLTLQILTGSEADEVSEASIYYRNKFKEVLVDEYQDINALQESILLHLVKEDQTHGNYFMVGDVKQSIYGFRQANPGLFLKKYAQYAEKDGGERIILAENFRSREQVLSFTNFIFTQLMDQDVGNLDYDKNAELVYGNNAFTDDDTFKTEILIYEKGNEEVPFNPLEETEDAADTIDIHTKSKGEILMVATKIKELIQNGFEIYDKDDKDMRPLEYKDIVLLTPTKNNNLEIQEIFQEVDIPSAINETKNFFQTTEVTIMMSLLRIIDNPFQDIPFVAVLRSPIVGLNETELTQIRIHDRQNDFYGATVSFVDAEFEDPINIRLQGKCVSFLEDLDKWREYARKNSVVDLIRRLYAETGYLHYVGGMSGGKQRRANLEALYERAASYDKTSFKGLYRFIRFIDKMQEKDKDLAEPISILAEQNAVRVMTIHASKGLEFPVVFLMDMSKRFNASDWTSSYIFDRELGVGLEYRNPSDLTKAQTLVLQAVKIHKKQNGYAEQMRLLYVALTRAEQKLFLVGSKKSKDKAFDDWNKGNGSDEYLLSPRLRLTTNNFMDWVGLSVSRHQLLVAEVSSIQKNPVIKNYPVSFAIDFYSDERLEEQLQEAELLDEPDWLSAIKENNITKLVEQRSQDDEMEEAVKIIYYNYPFALSTQTTNYQSVSEVKQLFEEPNSEQLNKIDWTQEARVNRYTKDLLKRPKFLKDVTPPTPTEIGQATHFLLQSIDLQQSISLETIQAEKIRLVAEGILDKAVAEKIEDVKIVEYFKTDFGLELIQYAEVLEKETLFSLMMDAGEVFNGMEGVDDQILIHGIIDGYYEKDGGLVLFDYKTDRVTHLGQAAEQELINRYKGQLNLYKVALESITKKSVAEVYIISLDLNKNIAL